MPFDVWSDYDPRDKVGRERRKRHNLKWRRALAVRKTFTEEQLADEEARLKEEIAAMLAEREAKGTGNDKV
jgi:hypothetical protein